MTKANLLNVGLGEINAWFNVCSSVTKLDNADIDKLLKETKKKIVLRLLTAFLKEMLI